MSTVYGELDPSGETILVTVTAGDIDLNQAAAVIRSLTPAFNPVTGMPDTLAVELSWAVITQLAHSFTGAPQWDGRPGLTWVPGPGLSDWLIAEIIRRSCEGDYTGRLPALEPMGHQHAGGVAVGMNGRFLFADDMGPQPVDTPVMLTSGEWTKLGLLKPGDIVYGQYGFAARVGEVKFFGRQPVYRVTFSDRTSTLANGAHRWRVFTANHRARPDTRLGEEGYLLSTEQLLERGLRDGANNRRFFLPQQPVLQYGRAASWYTLDPYAYGVLLGDGHLSAENCELTCPDEDILIRVEEQVLADTMTTSRQGRRPDHCASVAFHRNGTLRSTLDGLGALVNSPQKFVASEYARGNAQVRRELLRGLLDTDGSVGDTGAQVEFCSASRQLASDVAFLARSLGAVATESGPQLAHYVLDGVRHPALDKHRVHMRFPAAGPNPFWCERKASAWAAASSRVQRKLPPRLFESIEPEGEAEVCCIRVEDANHVYLTDRTLIPTHNTGKTLTYFMGLAELEARGRHPWPALLVTPANVIDTVLEELPKFYPDWKAAAYRGSSRRRLLKSDARLLVMGYETMRNDVGEPGKGALNSKAFRPGTVIFDECVTYDTRVEVRGGIKHVCYVQPGEQVKGVDHETGAVTWSTVQRVGRSPLRKTVHIGHTEMSMNHPVWVSDDGCVAYATGCDKNVCLLPVWGLIRPEVVPELAGAEVLREDLRAGVAGRGRDDEGARTPGGESSARITEDAGVPVLGAESVPWFLRRAHTPTWARHERRERVAGSFGRQWHGAYYPAGAVVEATRRGVHPRVLSKPWPEGTWVPDELQAGPGEPGAEDRNRAARREPPGSGSAGTRREEAGEAGVTWLDSPGLLERGDPARSLWNLETDTGNYFANGILTHNCHVLCNYDSLQSRMARRLAKHVPNVIAGSGTPITKTVAGFWPILNSMYPGSYPSRERYKSHYCLSRPNKAGYGTGDSDVTGLDPLREPEFRVAMQGVYRRVALEDVVDMPPKTYQTRYVEIPDAWRAAYNQMEQDMLAELPDQMTPLEAMSVLAKMTRLRQLACSACDVKAWTELEANPRSPNFGHEVTRTQVTLKEPCWKGAALVGLLDELHQAEGEHDNIGRQFGHDVGSRPVIAFAESAQLIRLAGAMAEKRGYVTGYIDGNVSTAGRKEARLAFQDNRLDLICVTTGAGGVGLNLTAAGDVAFLARPWGYVPAVQSERRAWRRGQTKPVMIYDFVAKNTVESRIFARLREKAGNLADLVLDRRIVEDFLGGRR